MPDGVTRTVDGDVVRVAFPADLGDRSSMAAARASSEEWLGPLVPTDPAPGWNELGDGIVAATRPVDLPPFTFYDTYTRAGYKELTVDVDGETWAELAAIACAGALADGTPVCGVRGFWRIFPPEDLPAGGTK